MTDSNFFLEVLSKIWIKLHDRWKYIHSYFHRKTMFFRVTMNTEVHIVLIVVCGCGSYIFWNTHLSYEYIMWSTYHWNLTFISCTSISHVNKKI